MRNLESSFQTVHEALFEVGSFGYLGFGAIALGLLAAMLINLAAVFGPRGFTPSAEVVLVDHDCVPLDVVKIAVLGFRLSVVALPKYILKGGKPY